MNRSFPPPGLTKGRPGLSPMSQDAFLLALPLNTSPRHKGETNICSTCKDFRSPQPLSSSSCRRPHFESSINPALPSKTSSTNPPVDPRFKEPSSKGSSTSSHYLPDHSEQCGVQHCSVPTGRCPDLRSKESDLFNSLLKNSKFVCQRGS